jgi:hypothetical protein
MKAIKENIEGMMNSLDSMEKIRDDSFTRISDGFKKIVEESAQAAKNIDHLTDTINTY